MGDALSVPFIVSCLLAITSGQIMKLNQNLADLKN